MNKYTKILPVILLFCGVCLIASADRGRFVIKKKIELNVGPAANLKSAIEFNLKSGLVYRGSSILSEKISGNSVISDVMISYKKGNTIYMLPYKQRISIPKNATNTEPKLIIRLKK